MDNVEVVGRLEGLRKCLRNYYIEWLSKLERDHLEMLYVFVSNDYSALLERLQESLERDELAPTIIYVSKAISMLALIDAIESLLSN